MIIFLLFRQLTQDFLYSGIVEFQPVHGNAGNPQIVPDVFPVIRLKFRTAGIPPLFPPRSRA